MAFHHASGPSAVLVSPMEHPGTGETSFFEHLSLIGYRCLQRGVERKFSFLSPCIETILGFPSDLLQRDPRAFFLAIHEDDRNKFLREWEDHVQAIPRVVHLNYRLVTPAGKAVWIHERSVISAIAPNHEKECQGILFLAHPQEPLQSELAQWDRELKSLTENLPDVIGRFDRRLRILYLNRTWDGLEVLSPDQYLGKHIESLGWLPAVTQIVTGKIQEVFAHALSSTIEITYPTSHGMKFFDVRFIPEPPAGDRVITVLMICRDITEVRAGEAAFRESEEKFRQMAETIDSVFWIWDVELQRMTYVSPAYDRLWGGDARKLMQNPFDWLTLVVPEDRPRVETLFLKREDQLTHDIEYRISTRAKGVRWIHNRTFLKKGSDQEGVRVIGIAQDVTERKQWEEERLRSAKLESLGLLAGGLAHDFNNLLTTILGQVSLAKYGLDASDPMCQRLTEAEKASTRAQEIASQLLTFSKGGAPVKKIVDIGHMVEEHVRLVLAGSNVRPVFGIAQGLGAVNADTGQLCQVIHNLVINARQAMERGGECIVQAFNVEGEAIAQAGYQPIDLKKGRWVKIDIRDRGVGIPKDHLTKIFDPYFTTKATGSGLGLATSYSIIRNHGGLLLVDSEVGKGSTFSIVLPSVPHPEPESTVPDQDIQKGKGKILIMDDEAPIRQILGEMVETCGYSSVGAKDGEEALQLFREAQKTGPPFSAVILDLTVPGGMGGKEVIQGLLQLDPHVKAIVVSGYSNDPVLANYQDYGFMGRVAKPFNLLDISFALHSVLQGAPSSFRAD